jgi:hypothetical protein
MPLAPWIAFIFDIMTTSKEAMIYCICKRTVWSHAVWQDLHDDDKTCMQSSYWELVLENGQ